MALGPGMFKEKYKDYSLEQLNNELDELKKYLVSDELKQARQEEINKGIDDNNCITNVESEIEAIESLIKEKKLILPKDTGKMFIRKYKTDGTEEELEIDLPKFEMPPFTPEESKYYVNISKLLDISIFECKEYSKRIPEENATYYYNPARGGKCVIVSDDGSYLSATSSVNFERHLEEFKTGRRNGNFNDTTESNDKILKINCHSCNNEIVIDCSKLPTNIKTLDTMCPNCKSFIKYANLNYVEETKKEYTQDDYKHFFYRQMTEEEKEKLNALNCNDKISKLITSNYQIKYLNDIGYLFIGEGYLILENGTEPTHYFAKIFKTKEEAINEIEQNYSEKFNDNENETITISAIEKTGIPTKQIENTALFVSKENAVIDNKKVLIDDKRFNFIINIIDQKLNKIKEIKNQQTPEFLNNHVSYDNKSKIFSIKYNNEEVSINYHTGTESDKYIIELINLIIDILMKDNKEIENELNSAFEQDLNNINSMLKDVENMIFGENKNFSLAKEKLLDFVKGVSIFENDNETDYYNFDDVIQFVIYTKLNKTNKKIVWSSIPFLTAYSYLAYVYNEEKNYDEALNIIDKQMKIAPLNLSAYFEKCETYKMQKMWEQFKEETQKIYTKIYDAKDLAHLYRNLGFYYIEQNKLDLAYALYTASIQFEKHRLAYSEMMYINQQLGRENYSMSAEETLKLLDDNNIPFGAKKENVDLLISIYENEKELIKDPNTEMLLASKIYYLSEDSKFAPYYEEVDNTTGCAIIIPRSWKPIKQEVIEKEFSKNQMFAIYTDTNALFQGVYDGKCPIDEFDKAYNLNIENMKKSNMNLLYESILDLKLQKGVKKFKCALFETKGIRIYNCFTLINGIFVNFSINVSSEIDFNDSSKFNNQKNMVDLINVLSSILELNKDDNSGIQKDIKEDNVANKINSVCEIYKKNNDITKVIDIVKEAINSKEIDPFWLDTARYAFIYLILKQFNDNQKCDYTTLIEIISDKDKFVKICKEAKNVNSDSSYLSEYASKIINSTDKMIDSYYEIICSCLNVKAETSTNNSELNKLIEDTITNEDISLKETILNIVELIIDLLPETTTTIAELIKYEPEKSFVEPLTQGKIFNYVFDVCKKMNINLEKVDKSFGGLAYYYTFKKADKKENNNDELIEHTINSNISFKFKLPKLYGETTKKTDISFKIGNSINVMIAKCSDISKLDDRSLQWLENSAKTNNQNILKDKVRKYFLNNDTIQVIERMVEKDDQRRMYKFVYLNESMIIFAFGTKGYNEKFENTINNAIISIKEIGNQEKVERDPFEKVNNSNDVDEKVKKYMNDFIDKEVEQSSNIDSEFLEYSKLYKEKFGKNAYIAMPDGTKEQTINAIKECLKRNEDVLDKILYPTFEKDMEDGVLY
ncbi:MAG: hypothetical protein ACI4OG_03375 [Bacilli bacterium]